jgi:hypothetical protein
MLNLNLEDAYPAANQDTSEEISQIHANIPVLLDNLQIKVQDFAKQAAPLLHLLIH